MRWQLRDAKSRSGELVERARREGPQFLAVRDQRVAVVVSAETYDALTAARPSLVDHLLAGPVWDDNLVEAVNARSRPAA